MNKEVFDNGIMALTAIFPNVTIPINLYWTMLKDLTDDEYIRAINAILKSTKELYPNTNLIAMIREHAKVQNRILPGEAWEIVCATIMSVGSYGSPKFSDPLIWKAVSAMGWRQLCLSTNQAVDRAHFMKIYESYINRDTTDRVIGKLNSLPISKDVKKLIDGIGKIPNG